MWILMLIPVGIVLGLGVYFVFRALRGARLKRQLYAFTQPTDQGADASATPVSISLGLSLFEQPCRWLAIKGENLSAVQSALNLHHVVPCSWEEGLMEAQEDKLFISPPIASWILVVGSGLPDPAEDVDRCFRFLTDLSRKLGQVQFFSTNRVLNHHAWALIEKGHVYRAYAWADNTLWNQGVMTSAERELELRCFDYGSELIYTQREGLSVNSEKVTQLAARWSIDPSAISETNWSAGNGIVGELSRPKSL